ncbi:MAG TPA: ABC transporter permease [Terriglobales bacterium]|nr:ABC transporter permease [Terriglobales bacterium]
MIKSESFEIAIDALRANKARAALTIIGVVIGSACIVLVVTITLVGRNYVVRLVEGVGSNLVYAYYSGDVAKHSLADEISVTDFDAAKSLPHVAQAAGTNDFGSQIVIINGHQIPVALIGVTEGFQQIRNLLILEGRYFDDIDMQTNAKACLISEDLAKQFNDDMLGQKIKVGDLTFTIIGVFRERVSTFGQSEIRPESVLIPFPIMRFYLGKDYLRTLYVQADSPDTVQEVTQEVKQMLAAHHRNGSDYSVENLVAVLAAARKISFALSAVLLLLSGIALVVSGVGIMNIMLVTVTERTKEIGVRKAVGAKRSQIRYEFLFEALLISGTGAILGILLAIGLVFAVQPLIPPQYSLHIPLLGPSMILAFLVSCLTGVIFGYIPANRASKLHPTESLHYE